MILHEMLKEEYQAGEASGREEGKTEVVKEILLEFLEEKGAVPEKLREKIFNVSDLETLRKWNKWAAKAESIEQFIEEIQ